MSDLVRLFPNVFNCFRMIRGNGILILRQRKPTVLDIRLQQDEDENMIKTFNGTLCEVSNRNDMNLRQALYSGLYTQPHIELRGHLICMPHNGLHTCMYMYIVLTVFRLPVTVVI